MYKDQPILVHRGLHFIGSAGPLKLTMIMTVVQSSIQMRDQVDYFRV
ncbi:hypothetical protein JOD43_003506 [Pullulanibacillus pueri]|nr:hypothetical protein [Pullulanibacillus pueri]